MSSGQLHSHFGVLARLAPSSQEAQSKKSYASQDFLVAFTGERLHFFRTAVNRTCPCYTKQTDDSVSAAEMTREDFASLGFHCPHASGFECYDAHSATIPMRAIDQVLMTYRTTVAVARSPNTKLFAANTNSNAVAARTQDLLLKFTDGSLLWLTFEHNLLRGGFLEALMSSASTTSSACIDVDYIDLNEHSGLATTVDLEQAFPPIAIPLASNPQQYTSFYVRRDALRCVLYDKIQITLQLAQESMPGTGSSDSELMCHYMLGTSMTLAKALNEPDLVAFSWLASASINTQSQSLEKRELAQPQAAYAIKIAKTNSLAYLLFLALRCASDSCFLLGDAFGAKAYLLQAAAVVPDTLETRLRMELHRRIQELRVWIDNNSGAASLNNTRPETPFSLWAHCTFGSSPRRPGLRDRQNSAPATTPKDLLLRRVAKHHAFRGGDGFACYVGLVGPQGSNSTRVRVFIDDDSCTFHWLELEVMTRLLLLPSLVSESTSASSVRVDKFYGPSTETKTIPKDTALRDVLVKTNETVWARITSVEDTQNASKPRASSSSMISGFNASAEASITCSLCQKRVSLDDVETHSESCY